jgi:polysaccharide export outer membrane protein
VNSSPATDQPPDLTFKPGPQDATPTPPPGPAPIAPTPEKPAPEKAVPTPTPKAAAAKGTPPAADAGPDAPDSTPHYVLGANDVISIEVFDEKNVSGTYTIGPDGRISVPLIGDFRAVGLTLPQLKVVLTKKLGDFVIEPEVNVQLLRNNSKRYTLIGGVLKTGPYPLLQDTTILDALAASGGFKDFANSKKIILRRGTKEFKFNYKDVTHGKHMEQNINIEDGDIIIVPE